MTPLRVIVADDEKMARKRVTRLLEQLGNTVLVAECRSGDEVLRHLDPAHVDVALLDVDMPGMNGLETARLAALRGVPVIFLTAHEQHAVGERAAHVAALQAVEGDGDWEWLEPDRIRVPTIDFDGVDQAFGQPADFP